jgi:hypothetical protein
MKQFAPLLKKINRKLDLPQPERSRIILEIAMDLEDLYNFYRQKGLDENDAILKAEEKLALSDKTLDELREIHKSGYRKFLEKISENTRSRWEKTGLTVIILLFCYLIIQSMLQTPFFRTAGTMILPSLFLFGLILGLSMVKFYMLFIRKDHRLQNLHSGMSLLLFLITVNLSLGIFGYVFELFRNSGKGLMMINYLLITMTVNSVRLLNQTVEAILKSSSMAMVSILVTLISGFIWFNVSNKISKIEQAEVMFLLTNQST